MKTAITSLPAVKTGQAVYLRAKTSFAYFLQNGNFLAKPGPAEGTKKPVVHKYKLVYEEILRMPTQEYKAIVSQEWRETVMPKEAK